VIDRYGAFLFPLIRREFPKANVSLLPETKEIVLAAREVASSHVFVGCHISGLILGMFSHAVVVEVQPKGLGCTSFGRMWTSVSGAFYLPSSRQGICACNFTNFSCYLGITPDWHGIDESAVIRAIAEAFQDGDVGSI
jgi:hypothetical protein